MRMKLVFLPIVVVAIADTALAQAPPPAAIPPGATTTSPSPNSPVCVPHDIPALDGKAAGERKKPLGEKLAKSDGVVCPPEGINPEIRALTPEGGNMPVIPPPGTPGGDPTVRPK